MPGVQEQSLHPTPPTTRWLWLDRIDSNNRRSLAPQVATGVRALTNLAKHFNFPGPWQAITSFFYTANILLVPSSTAKFASSVTHCPTISKLRDIKTAFQSTLPLLVSTTFAATGLKEACQLLGYAVKPLECDLNIVVPWVVSACRINVFFQIHDIVKGLQLRSEINRTLTITKTNSEDRLGFCIKILETIERHHGYLQDCDQISSLSIWNAMIHTQMKEEQLSQLTERIRKSSHLLLQWSYRQVAYQTAGFFANVLSIAMLITTNSVAASVLLLGASATNISREFWKKRK